MKRNLLIVSCFVLFLNFSYEKPKDKTPDFITLQSKWVDSVFNALTPDERITQLFMIAAYSNKDMKHVREIREIIQKYNVGGLIMMQGSPMKHAKLVNYFQDKAKTPLLLSIDGEWGLAMRLDSTPRYPKQMALGAIQNDSLIYFMGKQIAKECKRVGLHVNFAPVVDVNNNPANPVIGIRSFGEDKYKVAKKAYMYMKGMQDERVMANAKHFPGHGDTDVDSHKGLPLINHPRQRLDSLELYPFRYLFDRGLASIMVAHLNVPALDTTKNLASTLSPKIVTDLLRKEMGFEGLVFTDALNMKGASDYFTPGVIDVKALQAGNDVLLFLNDVPKALEEIKKAIAAGTIKQEEIDVHCKKVLKAKYWCGLGELHGVRTKNLNQELNTRESDILNTKLAEATMTLLKNDKRLLPLKNLDSLKIAEVSVGMEEENIFSKSVVNYAPVKHFGIEHDAKKKDIDSLFARLRNYNFIILQVNKSTLRPDKNYGITEQSLRLIDSIASLKPTVAVFFNNPYVLNSLKWPSRLESVLMAYEYTVFTQRAAANAIFGAIKVNGKLPVSTKYFKLNTGLQNEEILRMKFEDSKTMGIQKKNLELIDSIANLGIKEKAYPGCQIVAIKDGKVFFQKSYGTFTYDSASPKVTDQTVYDLASITKISSSCLALMKLRSEGKFDYKKTLGYYLPEVAESDKKDLVIEDVLTHQAGLMAWIPFYLKTIDKQGNYKPGYYDDKRSKAYPVQVAKDLYAASWVADTMFNRILRSKFEEKGKYLYSDLGYYFMQRIIQVQTSTPQEIYVEQNFYKPMGLGLTYRPLEKYKLNEIAPTENDTKFRKQVVHGYVHDPGAAMLGGVAGHAGLFGTAKDLATLMQMYLNKGNYGGVQYLDSNVVKDFTSYHFPNNRRGLCFDKPEPDPKKDSPVNELCSSESYGHSGFTGTFTWVDPKNKLIVVFLSNRVYPDAEDNKLAKLGIRGKIHKAFYEALENTIPLPNYLK